MRRWRPIETAPKDGTEFLMWSPIHGMAVVNEPANHGRGRWAWVAPCSRWPMGAWTGASDWRADTASHWCPLPEPPR